MARWIVHTRMLDVRPIPNKARSSFQNTFALMATFLELNGYSLGISEVEVASIMERLASNEETQEFVAKWLEVNSICIHK